MIHRLSMVICGTAMVSCLRQSPLRWIAGVLAWAVPAISGAAQQPAPPPDAFVLLSNANKPKEIVGKILYADNTLERDLTDGTYRAEKRSGGGSDGLGIGQALCAG